MSVSNTIRRRRGVSDEIDSTKKKDGTNDTDKTSGTSKANRKARWT